MKRVISTALVSLVSLSGTASGQDELEPIADEVARVTTLSFTGPSNVDWTHSEWDEDHAEYYTPTVKIDRTLPVDMSIWVRAYENRKYWSDPHLATMKVVFSAGQTTGTVRTYNDSEEQERGFPAVTENKFWLVVTKQGKIKGNRYKEDNGHARVYLEAEGSTKFAQGKKYMITTRDARNDMIRSAHKTVNRQ